MCVCDCVTVCVSRCFGLCEWPWTLSFSASLKMGVCLGQISAQVHRVASIIGRNCLLGGRGVWQHGRHGLARVVWWHAF